jgi:hypothetical protein
VAFPQKGSSQSYIFPALLESIPEEKNWREKECITTEFVYIDFMPKAIVNQLSAEQSDLIQIDIDGKEEVWNNAVNLIYEGLGKDQTATKCQVMEYFYKRKIIVNAVGPDARGLMMKIMDSLKRIAADYRGINYEIKIPCICSECKNTSDYDAKHKFEYYKLIERRDKGKKYARCYESDEDILIGELINGVGLTIPKDTEAGMKKIRIFLASSKELEIDRREFEIFIARENNKLIDQDIFLELVIWENFIDAISKTGLQEEYNKAAKQADIFISLFFTKVGPYTKKEFEVAFKQFNVSGKPLIYTYFKEAEINIKDVSEEGIGSLWDFQKKLGDLGHYYTTYTSTEDLKNQFRSQLEKLIIEGRIRYRLSHFLY